METRAAGAGDVDEMMRLAAVMFESIGLDASEAGWRARAPRVLVDGMRAGRIGAFVVEEPGGTGRLIAAGAVVVEQRLPTPHGPDGRIGYVQWVCTDVEHRRRGLARAVMQAIVAWTRAQDIGRVELHASPDGEALYAELGFQPTAPSYRLYAPAP